MKWAGQFGAVLRQAVDAARPSSCFGVFRVLRLTDVKLPLDHADAAFAEAARAKLGVPPIEVRVFRRAYDARKRSAIHLIYTLDVVVADESSVLARCAGDPHVGRTPDMAYRHVARAPAALRERPVVVGAGPCGLFAALTLAQMGFRPIILERGRQVRERTKDTFALWRRSELSPESNVQFGEGGAGTFSDGKLWSGVRDPAHLGRRVLEEFVRAGAPAEILVSSKPHIGTFRLVSVVESLRATDRGAGRLRHLLCASVNGCSVASAAEQTMGMAFACGLSNYPVGVSQLMNHASFKA